MGVGMGCLYACAPLTLIASILLFMMAVMLKTGNWSFQVLAAENGWDRSVKSRCCRNGGIIYICISAVLWVLVLLDSFVIHLEKVPGFVSVLWRQKRLPSWRELMRNRRKADQRGSRPAVDVVVTALPTSSASPLPPAATPTERQADAGAPPVVLSSSSSPQAVNAGDGASLLPPIASSPLNGPAYTGIRGGVAAPEQLRWPMLASENTSATTSLVEADHLLN